MLKFGEMSNKGWTQTQRCEPFLGPSATSGTCVFPRNQLPSPPVSSTRRHALIRYGRPCDRSHCLVDPSTAFLQGWCLSPVHVFVFGLWGLRPGSSHLRFAPSSAPIDCLATNRIPASAPPDSSGNWRDNWPRDRLLTDSI